jgi:hypothetical protein
MAQQKTTPVGINAVRSGPQTFHGVAKATGKSYSLNLWVVDATVGDQFCEGINVKTDATRFHGAPQVGATYEGTAKTYNGQTEYFLMTPRGAGSAPQPTQQPQHQASPPQSEAVKYTLEDVSALMNFFVDAAPEAIRSDAQALQAYTATGVIFAQKERLKVARTSGARQHDAQNDAGGQGGGDDLPF